MTLSAVTSNNPALMNVAGVGFMLDRRSKQDTRNALEVNLPGGIAPDARQRVAGGKRSAATGVGA
jgi:hypothetical protein